MKNILLINILYKNMGCSDSNSIKAEESKRKNNNVPKDLPIENELALNNKKIENKLNSDTLRLKQDNLPKKEEVTFKTNNIESAQKNNTIEKNYKENEKEKKEIIEKKDEKEKESREEQNKNKEKKQDINQIENTENFKKINEDILLEIEKLKMNGLKQIDKNDFPKCDDTLNLINLEKYFIEKSENLNYIEKSFFIYNWITMNISLDLSLKNNNEDKNLENIIKIGKSSNYDFAKLYKYLGEKLNLKIKYIEGYSKNLDKIENIPKDFIINHLYNLIEIEGNNYIIDTCFGSGEIIDSKYVKENNNFYYCIEPSKMISFNYPKDKNNQLLEKPIDYETFYNTAKLYINYFNLKIEKDNIKSNYNCEGKIVFSLKKPKDIEVMLGIYKLNEKTKEFEDYVFEYEINKSYTASLDILRYSLSQLEFGKNKLKIYAIKSKDKKIIEIPLIEEIINYREESELNFSLVETKFENEIRPNERLFTEEEKAKYRIIDCTKKLGYEFEPLENIVTLNDRIDYELTIDESKIFNNINFLVNVYYIKNGQEIDQRGVGFVAKSNKNKFIITGKFFKKGLYNLVIYINDINKIYSFNVFKRFQILCKHDFNIEKPLEKSRYLGGEGYKEEEINNLKEKGNDNINKILENAPKRVNSNLDEFTKYLIDKTKLLNDLEKAYLLFNWIGNNIEYDYEGMLYSTATVEINSVFKIGKTVCSGYSRLFRHLADNIDLITENIKGYVKGANFESDLKKSEIRLNSNHEYNAVKLNNKWYLIDSTWGAGYVISDGFKKYYKPYYFCTPPELLINSHYPLNENWQLLENPLNFKQFLSKLSFEPRFFADGFYKVEPNKAINNCSIGKNKLRIYKDNEKDIELSISIYKLEENPNLTSNYLQIGEKKYPSYFSNHTHLNKTDNYYDFEYELKERGEYYLDCSGKDTPGSGISSSYFKMYLNCS